MNVLESDKKRYTKEKMPSFQKYYRKAQLSNNKLLRMYYKYLFIKKRNKYHLDFSVNNQIGEGLYFGHPVCITINPNAVIGKNCNIHKGVTIGQENRGKRRGCPVIGDSVWIGINSTIVGSIKIGNDVLIAPNSYVNCDIPDHSVVFGNPCQIKYRDNATEGYINNKCPDEVVG